MVCAFAPLSVAPSVEAPIGQRRTRAYCKHPNPFPKLAEHFWGSDEAAKRFVAEDCDVIVTDPPFGGAVDALALTVQEFWRSCRHRLRKGPGITSVAAELPTVIVFPYFSEKAVLAAFPSATMTDYAVNYANHTV